MKMQTEERYLHIYFFRCPVCSNAFPSNSALSQHKKGVHGILGPNMKPPEKRIRKRKVVTVLVQ